MNKSKAIDLYSGIGGWTLGLKLASVEVVRSFEWWGEANFTHNMNFGIDIPETDIRKLDLSSLPKPGSIDFIVGSPPCTQFSFSNKGGKGDVEDGLKDIRSFLKIVNYLKPKYWVMENVPRVAQILKKELADDGQLSTFKNLVKVIEVLDMSDFGLPQARKRMFAGNFPIDLLKSYASKIQPLTLGDVLLALKGSVVTDPIYGYQLPKEKVADHVFEQCLTKEEERMNREAKEFHPVYNVMKFPDSLQKPARTVTATCTRVSRESIVIKDSRRSETYRRLTIRERGCLQSFPITFQFYGNSYSARMKMIGNALPPLMAYYIIQSMKGILAGRLRPIKESVYKHTMPTISPKAVMPDSAGEHYPLTRRFRAAIPHLRFGSGVRFELVNDLGKDGCKWHVRYFFGNSKNIRSIELQDEMIGRALNILSKKSKDCLVKIFQEFKKEMGSIEPDELQQKWSHKKRGTGPYELVDKIGFFVNKVVTEVGLSNQDDIIKYVLDKHGMYHRNLNVIENRKINGNRKICSNAICIYAGFLIGSIFNNFFKKE